MLFSFSLGSNSQFLGFVQWSLGDTLDIEGPKDFLITFLSLDEMALSFHSNIQSRWSVVIAEGEGQGYLLKIEMMHLIVQSETGEHDQVLEG